MSHSCRKGKVTVITNYFLATVSKLLLLTRALELIVNTENSWRVILLSIPTALSCRSYGHFLNKLKRPFSCFFSSAVLRPALKEYKNSSCNDLLGQWMDLSSACLPSRQIHLLYFGHVLQTRCVFASLSLPGWVSSFVRLNVAVFALDETTRETGCGGYIRPADTSERAQITSDCLFRPDYRSRVSCFRSQVTLVLHYVHRHLHVSGRRARHSWFSAPHHCWLAAIYIIWWEQDIGTLWKSIRLPCSFSLRMPDHSR